MRKRASKVYKSKAKDRYNNNLPKEGGLTMRDKDELTKAEREELEQYLSLEYT